MSWLSAPAMEIVSPQQGRRLFCCLLSLCRPFEEEQTGDVTQEPGKNPMGGLALVSEARAVSKLSFEQVTPCSKMFSAQRRVTAGITCSADGEHSLG